MDPVFTEQFHKLQTLFANGLINEADFALRKKDLVDAYVGDPVQKAIEAGYYQSLSPTDRTCVRMRGLPFTATEQDIHVFFAGFQIAENGIKLKLNPDGKPSGQAYVKFLSEAEAQRALSRNQAFIGTRYIEVFPSTLAEMNEKVPITGPTSWIRMRGLPFTCSSADIKAFFDGFSLMDTQIHIISVAGKPSGEAFVQFPDENEAQRALQKDKNVLGSRYIELFLSSADEYNSTVRNPSGVWDCPTANTWTLNAARGPRGPAVGDPLIRVRGLPFRATETEIQEFFKDLEIAPMGIHIVWAGGRPTGEAFIEFRTKNNADEALKLNRRVMGSRYIEVFPATRGEMQARMQSNPTAPEGGLMAAAASAYAPAVPDMSYYYGAENGGTGAF